MQQEQEQEQQAGVRPATPQDLDDDTLAFVRRVFGFARAGEAGELATLLDEKGIPHQAAA